MMQKKSQPSLIMDNLLVPERRTEGRRPSAWPSALSEISTSCAPPFRDDITGHGEEGESENARTYLDARPGVPLMSQMHDHIKRVKYDVDFRKIDKDACRRCYAASQFTLGKLEAKQASPTKIKLTSIALTHPHVVRSSVCGPSLVEVHK